MFIEEKFKNLCDLTTKLVGLPEGSLSTKSRKMELQVPRMVAAMVGRLSDDTHRSVIAKVLNRDRTSINHYETNHKFNYSTFPLYRDTFNKVFNAYAEIKASKLTFETINEFKKYLKEKGIKDSSQHQTTIRITSGQFKLAVNVSYKDFYNQLQLCKLAFENYQHEIEVV